MRGQTGTGNGDTLVADIANDFASEEDARRQERRELELHRSPLLVRTEMTTELLDRIAVGGEIAGGVWSYIQTFAAEFVDDHG